MNIFAKTINTADNPHSGLIAVAALGGFAILVGLVFYIMSRQNKAIDNVAQKNGWQALSTDDSTLLNYVPDYIRSRSGTVGHKYRIAYRAQAQGGDIVVFRYDDSVRAYNGINSGSLTTTDNQTNLQPVSYAIATFGVAQNFGKILITSHIMLNKPASYPGMKKFNLEGNFGKYFDVYAPEGSSIETLSVLTPDFMAYLVDLGRRYHWDIEIDTDRVSVVGDANLMSAKKIPVLLDYAQSIKQKLAAKPHTGIDR